MPFAALDLHKREIEAGVFDDTGKCTFRKRFSANKASLVDFARNHLSRDHHVIVEATFNTWAVVDTLEPLVASITVSDPMQTRAIAHAKVKTDKIDVNVLGHLLRLDYVPKVWIPDPATRQLRLQTAERAALSRDRTRLKNRIHAILNQRLIEAPADLFSPSGRSWLDTLNTDLVGRRALDRLLAQLQLVEEHLVAADKHLATQAYGNPQVLLLMTLPGIGFVTALALIATLGDIERFPTSEKAVACIGLNPSTYQSGEGKAYHGRITKQGSAQTRWLVTEAAQHLDTHPGPLGAFFRKIARRKNRNVAVVAAARKLVILAWHLLKTNQPYRYALSASTDEKLRILRLLATGERRQGGCPKGQQCTPKLPGGGLSRTIKSLPDLYASHGLPALATPPPGEARHLRQTDLTAFAETVLQTRIVSRKRTAAPAADS